MGRIIIYSAEGCRYCKQSQQLFKSLRVPALKVPVDESPEMQDKIYELSRKFTVPQIFFNDQFLGGWVALQRMLEDYGEEQFVDRCKEVLEYAGESSSNSPPLPEERLTKVYDAQVKAFLLNETAPVGMGGIGRCEDNKSEDCTSCRLTTVSDVKYHLLGTNAKIEGLVRRMRQKEGGLSIRTRSYHLRRYNACFVGSELVDWLISNKVIKSTERKKGVAIGKDLMDHAVIHHVAESEPFRDGNFYYRFQEDASEQSLNMHRLLQAKARDAQVVARELRVCLKELHMLFLSSDGRQVDYEQLRGSREFETYRLATVELQGVDLSKFKSREETSAFFINLYNALVIHGIIVKGAPTSTLGRMKFFSGTKYRIGAHEFSLNDIENGVLRGNKKGLASFSVSFGSSDPRLQYALPSVDPRIHFALVCGAKSCPPIKAYTAEGLERELSIAAKAFVSEDVKVDLHSRTVTLSKIFDWYKSDFPYIGEFKKPSTAVVLCSWIAASAPDELRSQLNTLIAGEVQYQRKIKLSFRKYDWGTNKGQVKLSKGGERKSN